MRTTWKCGVGRIGCLTALGLFGAGVATAAPIAATPSAPPAAARSPAPPAPAAPQTPAAPPSAPQSSDSSPRGMDHQNDAATHHRDAGIFPYGGYGFNYFAPNWYPYNNYGYGYGSSDPYPAQLAPQNSDQQASRPPDAYVPPPSPPSQPPTAALVTSPQWREADEQVKIAQSAYDREAARVLAQLKTNPDYREAVDRKNGQAQRVASLQTASATATPATTPPTTQRAEVAMAKLDAAKTVTDMETAALGADPQATAAKAKLTAALARRDEAAQAVQGAAVERAAPR